MCTDRYLLLIMHIVARPNPKGAPSAARGASSWVADLEAYSLYCFRAPWACCCPHACFGLFGSGLNVLVFLSPHAESERQATICGSLSVTTADGIMHMKPDSEGIMGPGSIGI